MPASPIPYDPVPWTPFFSAEASASGALAGLIFVAVSINLSRIIANRMLTSRSAKALATLLGVLTTATLCLVPAQPTHLLGWELTLTGLTLWSIITFTQQRSTAKNPYVSPGQKVFHTILAQGSILPTIAAGISLITHRGLGLYWLVPGVVLSFIAALLDSWVLLIEIQR
jgi:hypothetical protein